MPAATPPLLSRALGAALLAATLTGGAAHAQAPSEPIDLRPDWQPGQQSRYRFTQNRTRERELRAGPRQKQMTTRSELTGEIVWRVDEVNSDGSAECTVRYQWMKITINGPQGQQKVSDSRDPSGDLPTTHALFTAMTDTPLEVEVAPDGTIEEVTGHDAIRSALDEQNQEAAPSKTDLRSSIESLAPLPNAPDSAGVGDAWQHSFAQGHPLGQLQYDASYELAGVETIASIPVATVRVDAELALDPEPPARMPKGADMQSQLSESEYESFVIFDLYRHEAVGRYTSETQVIEQSVSMRGRSLDQSITQTVESTLLRLDEQWGEK